MKRLEVEDEIQLANILEEAVQGLYEDLDEVKKRERGLGGGRYDDEIQGCVVSICDERGGIVVRGCRRG